MPPKADKIPDRVEFLEREQQWLEFNDRVLHQALDERVPWLERVRFLTIFSSNLDEFFMKRVGGLRRQLVGGVEAMAPSNLEPNELLATIRARVLPMIARESACYREAIVPGLRSIGIELLRYDELTEDERDETRAWYRSHVFPILTPLAIDYGHRFPFISNLSLSLGVMLRRGTSKERMFARVKVPEIVDQWHRIGRSPRFVPLVDVIEHNLSDLFPGMEVVRSLPFRVTRNADIESDHEDAEDLLAHMELQLRERRFAPVVRIQIGPGPSKRLLEFLASAMGIDDRDVYEASGLIDYGSLEKIADLPLFEHRFPPWTPVIPPRLRDSEKDIFDTLRRGDLLVHHPYESFDTSVERFVAAAADDPHVLAIKQALYRTSGDSPFIEHLIRAAEAGKQVAVLVEVRARFDEARNIYWARKLEDAGVHVAYGVVGLKTHTKITLVVRQETQGLGCYAHIGTGNYHSRTAKLYEDVGLLTARGKLTDDVVNLFNYITGRSQEPEYAKLIVAPVAMRRAFVELIEAEITNREAGRPARIVAKMNQLQDQEIIRALYRASQAGVPVDLIVRGFCILRPGVPGMSDNIRVVSIIGRFLEHSRIFHFANGEETPADGLFFIGSADWMYRNLDHRVEAACPVERRSHRRRLWMILETALADHRLAWDMQSDGSYVVRRPDGLPPDAPASLGTHQVLMNLALESIRPVSDHE